MPRLKHTPQIDDEDRMITQLELHKGLKGFAIKALKEAGIECEASSNNDPRGDILLIRRKDIPAAKSIIRSIHERFSA